MSYIDKFLRPNILKTIFYVLVSAKWFSSFLFAGNHTEHLIKELGELAWVLLLFVIFVSLLNKLLIAHGFVRNIFARVLFLRKQAGIFMFFIAFSHAFTYLGQFPGRMLEFAFSPIHAAGWGSLAMIAFLPVLITSTEFAVKKMGFRLWKNVQRITHMGFVFVCLHVALLNYFGRGRLDFAPLMLLGLYVAGYLYLFLRRQMSRQIVKK